MRDRNLRRFRVSVHSEDIVFDWTVAMDLVRLSSKTCLNIVYNDTLLNAACFRAEESSRDDREAYNRIWANLYFCYSENIYIDQGPQFMSEESKIPLMEAGTKLTEAEIEIYNSLGVPDRYYLEMVLISCNCWLCSQN